MASNTIPIPKIPEADRPKPAVIFVRTRSQPHDAAWDQAQLRAQLYCCQQVAEELGTEVARVYLAVGGAADSHVQELIERLLQTVEAAGVEYVIVTSFDRLTRRPSDLAKLARRLAAAGARLVTTADRQASFLEAVSLTCLMFATASNRRPQ
jgi:DNA invertase Pin-like site-specific DNA recombinase